MPPPLFGGDDSREYLAEDPELGRPRGRAELELELSEHGEAIEEAFLPTLAEANELRARICGVRRALDEAHLLELVDELPRRLLAHAEPFRQDGEARAFEVEMGQQRRVRDAQRLAGPRADAPDRTFVQQASGLEQELERALGLLDLELRADVLNWDFDRLVMAHGDVIASGAREPLVEALHWLRAGAPRLLSAA